MGGQACIFYGAAEFSRDVDFAILASAGNLSRLAGALRELEAECIAVPPFLPDYLEKGHAIHFRCQHPDARGMRIDVMSRLRGVAPFPELWARRTTVTAPDSFTYELLALPDLVQAKKTQRDKDWPMIRRLVEAHYFAHRDAPDSDRVRFWLRELRTPELLIEAARGHPDSCRGIVGERPLLARAILGDTAALAEELAAEEQRERERDREYWSPLREELERLRLARPRSTGE